MLVKITVLKDVDDGEEHEEEIKEDIFINPEHITSAYVNNGGISITLLTGRKMQICELADIKQAASESETIKRLYDEYWTYLNEDSYYDNLAENNSFSMQDYGKY